MGKGERRETYHLQFHAPLEEETEFLTGMEATIIAGFGIIVKITISNPLQQFFEFAGEFGGWTGCASVHAMGIDDVGGSLRGETNKLVGTGIGVTTLRRLEMALVPFHEQFEIVFLLELLQQFVGLARFQAFLFEQCRVDLGHGHQIIRTAS